MFGCDCAQGCVANAPAAAGLWPHCGCGCHDLPSLGRQMARTLGHPAHGVDWCVGCGRKSEGRWCSEGCKAAHEDESGYDRVPDKHERAS
jgi:hypothetical protein